MASVLVTGAARGIGLELVRQCVARGDRVVATVRHPSPELQEIARDAGDRLVVVAMDVTDDGSIATAHQQVTARLAQLDLLFNCAGIYSYTSRHWDPAATGLGALSRAELLDVFNVNAAGPILVTRAFLDLLRKAPGSRVINLSSLVGSVAAKLGGGDYAYAASKAALNIMTRALAAELRPEGIIALAVTPGWVRTGMGGERAPLDPRDSVRGLLALADRLRPEDAGSFLDYQGMTQPW